MVGKGGKEVEEEVYVGWWRVVVVAWGWVSCVCSFAGEGRGSEKKKKKKKKELVFSLGLISLSLFFPYLPMSQIYLILVHKQHYVTLHILLEILFQLLLVVFVVVVRVVEDRGVLLWSSSPRR